MSVNWLYWARNILKIANTQEENKNLICLKAEVDKYIKNQICLLGANTDTGDLFSFSVNDHSRGNIAVTAT